jgi:RHS repeat-associated protein
VFLIPEPALSQAEGLAPKEGARTWGTRQPTITYDRYGNISKSGNGSFQATYDGTTNRIVTVAGEANPSYDANGNLLSADSHTYTWEPNWGNPSSIDGKTLTYDALGRMVEAQNGSSTTQFMFGPTGRVAIMNGQTEVQALQNFPGGGVFVHRPGSLTNYWRHADVLGSSRLATTLPGRGLFYDGAYAPFGESYAETGTTDRSFTGQTQDTTNTFGGLYDFAARKYSPTQGRWISPDPAGMAAANLKNPQSWNRYAYVLNDPLSTIDPFGTDPIIVNGVNAGDPLDSLLSSGSEEQIQNKNQPQEPAPQPAPTDANGNPLPPPVPVPGAPNFPWKWNPNKQNPRGGTWGPDGWKGPILQAAAGTTRGTGTLTAARVNQWTTTIRKGIS